jgi:DedD protein
MTEDLRKRLIGAAVLVSLAVIFIPMLLEKETVIDSSIYSSNIPQRDTPAFNQTELSEQDLIRKKQELAFGTTIKPQEDTQVKTVSITATKDNEASQSSQNITTRVGLTSWIVQVGSFSNQENAIKVVDQLRKAGYDTHLETAQVKSKKVYRVRVGPEVDKNNADKIAKAISKKFFLSAKVLRYP